jgi:hypothetical protein
MRMAAKFYGTRVTLIAILVATIIVIILAPLGMEWIAKASRDWVRLGNVGQAYGGVSALISAIALAGVVGSLLIQARQHSLDRITLTRSRQAQIYAIVREEPELYWPVVGNDYNNDDSVRREIFVLEYFHYFATGYLTGLFSEESLREETLPRFFRYQENREFWEIANRQWALSPSNRREQRFTRIMNEELARAKATGPGLVLPYRSEGSRGLRLDRGSRRCLCAFAGASVAGLRRVPDLPSFMQYAVVGRYLRRL